MRALLQAADDALNEERIARLPAVLSAAAAALTPERTERAFQVRRAAARRAIPGARPRGRRPQSEHAGLVPAEPAPGRFSNRTVSNRVSNRQALDLLLRRDRAERYGGLITSATSDPGRLERIAAAAEVSRPWLRGPMNPSQAPAAGCRPVRACTRPGPSHLFYSQRMLDAGAWGVLLAGPAMCGDG